MIKLAFFLSKLHLADGNKINYLQMKGGIVK